MAVRFYRRNCFGSPANFSLPFIQSANNSLKVAGCALVQNRCWQKVGIERICRSLANWHTKASCREFTNGSSFAFLDVTFEPLPRWIAALFSGAAPPLSGCR
jgi:hypothetical protein